MQSPSDMSQLDDIKRYPVSLRDMKAMLPISKEGIESLFHKSNLQHTSLYNAFVAVYREGLIDEECMLHAFRCYEEYRDKSGYYKGEGVTGSFTKLISK